MPTRQQSGTGELGFAPPRSPLTFVLIGLSILLGAATWYLGYNLTRQAVLSAIIECPSPLLAMLDKTAYRLSTPIEKADEVEILKLLLAQMRTRGFDGKITSDDNVAILAKEISTQLKDPAKNSVFSMSGIETVIALVKNNDISKPNENVHGDQIKKWQGDIVEALSGDNAIIQSSNLAYKMVSEKGIPEVIQQKLPEIMDPQKQSEVDTKLLLWPQTFQFITRCIQVMQNNDRLRNARFWSTFVGGPDILVMASIFWGMVIILLQRSLIARHELRRVKTLTPKLKHWEANLRQNNFTAVLEPIKQNAGYATTGRSPILGKMLDLTYSELKTRGNYSQPDSLLVWTQNVRDENNSSRWSLNWCGRALPTIGFIWKVLGIALAMKDSDTIALASGSYEQSAAIAHVSSSLGLAFSATVVAFTLSLIAGLAEAYQGHFEKTVLSRLENGVLPLLLVPPERT
jgi:hypothetical protein